MDHPGNRGILNKMEYQRAAFSELTETSDSICNSIRGPLRNGEALGEYTFTGRGFDSLNHYFVFYFHVARQLASTRYDFLYVRYPLAIPGFLGLLRAAKRANPRMRIVIEIATFPYRRELEGFKRGVLRTFDDLGHGQLKRYADLIVTFYGQSEIFGVPCMQLSNGVDVSQLPRRAKSTGGAAFSMVVVGNLAPRHGIDRVLRGMSDYLATRAGASERDLVLHVVGVGPSTDELRALTAELRLDEHVHFHGLKSGEALDEVFDQADVALDSLAIHRLQLPRSSSLKAREYCARGIPFVLASEDADFPERLKFVHRVPASEDPLDIRALIDFHARLGRETDALVDEIRAYAEAHLTWKAKLSPLVDYLRRETHG